MSAIIIPKVPNATIIVERTIAKISAQLPAHSQLKPADYKELVQPLATPGNIILNGSLVETEVSSAKRKKVRWPI